MYEQIFITSYIIEALIWFMARASIYLVRRDRVAATIKLVDAQKRQVFVFV